MIEITVLYSCEGCRLQDVQVSVPARVDDSDVVVWMKSTLALVAHDHRRRSPLCRARALQEVKIPATGVDRVGGPPVN